MKQDKTARRKGQKGVAAVEFALILPLLVAMALGIFELCFRYEMADELKRFSFQVGDYLSRSDGLSDTDLDEIVGVANRMMPSVKMEDADLSVDVASVGFLPDGEPVLLWERSRGTESIELDLEKVRGLAPPGESVIVAATVLDAPTIFATFGSNRITLRGFAVLKPRTTRAIAFDGSLADPGVTADGYESG